VTREPRELLATAGMNYLPAEDEEVCCGFGGSYSIDFPELSAALLQRKLARAEATGADFLATDCPGCVLQLRGGMDRKSGRRIMVKHLVELLEP